MRVSLPLFILLFLCVAFLPKSVFAHELATDKNISIIMHVEPDDDPTPMENSTLYFNIKDSKNEFNISNCNCNLTIKESDRKVFSERLTGTLDKTSSLYNSSVKFVFPKIDNYEVIVNGKPNNGVVFTPFSVSWNINVTKSPKNGLYELLFAPIAKLFVILIALIIVAVAVTKVVFKIRPKREE